MALTWSVENVQNYQEVCTVIATEDWPMDGTKKGDELWNPVTTALVWHSLNTGIGRITEANAGEVYARIRLIEEVYGASLRNSEGDSPITKEDVQRHIGLSTNASFKDETRSSFMKRHFVRFLDDAKYRYEKEMQAEAVA